MKQSSLIANVLQILQNNTTVLPTISELLTTYIDINILIRRESLILAASVIANEASSIALCITIYVNSPINNEKNNMAIEKIQKALDEILNIMNRLKNQPPSKVPTNSLFEIIFLKTSINIFIAIVFVE